MKLTRLIIIHRWKMLATSEFCKERKLSSEFFWIFSQRNWSVFKFSVFYLLQIKRLKKSKKYVIRQVIIVILVIIITYITVTIVIIIIIMTISTVMVTIILIMFLIIFGTRDNFRHINITVQKYIVNLSTHYTKKFNVNFY